jgi:hypothetical protein
MVPYGGSTYQPADDQDTHDGGHAADCSKHAPVLLQVHMDDIRVVLIRPKGVHTHIAQCTLEQELWQEGRGQQHVLTHVN